MRYALLVIIAIVSTTIFYVILTLWEGSGDLVAPINACCNVWCIILIHKANQNVYNKICFSCHGGMTKCCKLAIGNSN